MSGLGKKILQGTVWVTIDRFGTMALSFIVNLILARLLLPADFGCIGMLAIFISVSQVLVDGGFGSALIQKKNPTEEDYSTIFYWNLLFSLLLYGIIFLISPYVAFFFKIPSLRKVLRILALVLIINALMIVQNNRLRKQLAFSTLAWINISSHLVSALIAIILAYKGFGVWSLVVLQLMSGVFQNCMLWGVVRWYPKRFFSFQSLKELFSFGGYLMAANILQSVCINLQGIIIGRKFSASQMGYYSQAKKLDDMCSHNVPNIIVQVIYPVYSKFQNEPVRMQDLLGKSIRLISFVIIPMMFLLILIAQPLIDFLYGDKWLISVPYFQVLCVGGIFVCLQNINYYAIAAMGESQALFRWSFYKWGLLLLLLLIGSSFGMYGILWAMVISEINIFITNAILAFKYTGYSVLHQFKDFLPVLLISTLSFIGVYLLKKYVVELHFLISAICFLMSYMLLTYLFHLTVIRDLDTVKTLLKNGR